MVFSSANAMNIEMKNEIALQMLGLGRVFTMCKGHLQHFGWGQEKVLIYS